MRSFIVTALFVSALATGSAFAAGDNNGAEELSEIARADAPYTSSQHTSDRGVNLSGGINSGASTSAVTFGNDLIADPHNVRLNFQNGR